MQFVEAAIDLDVVLMRERTSGSQGRSLAQAWVPWRTSSLASSSH